MKTDDRRTRIREILEEHEARAYNIRQLGIHPSSSLSGLREHTYLLIEDLYHNED